jgi:isoquinoline 1-oxidoreductase alpha subunit
MAIFSLSINRLSVKVDADPETPLLWALRDQLGLVGTKFGCGGGFCGACTIHVDGAAARSCTLPLGKAVGREITTIEGIGARSPAPGARQELHPVQRAWLEIDVPQCGYCQAGQIMSAAALLARTPNPSDEQITAAMNGNICRCGTYVRIREAVRRAASFSNSSAGKDN